MTLALEPLTVAEREQEQAERELGRAATKTAAFEEVVETLAKLTEEMKALDLDAARRFRDAHRAEVLEAAAQAKAHREEALEAAASGAALAASSREHLLAAHLAGASGQGRGAAS